MSNLAVQEIKPEYTLEQIKLIRDTVAKGATEDEFKLFMYRARTLGFDPLKPGQIYFIKYGTSPGTIVVGIDGFRARAARSGKLSGIKRGAIRTEKGDLIGAWAEVFRLDWQHSARIEVDLQEYTTGKAMWAKMPSSMIQKVAEAAALRMAFPDDLGGLYTSEEMDQAANSLPLIKPEQPIEGVDGNWAPENHHIVFGKKFVGMSAARVVADYPEKEIAEYFDFVEDFYAKKSQPLPKGAKSMIDAVSAVMIAKKKGEIANQEETP